MLIYSPLNLGMSKKQLDPPPSQPALNWLLLNFLAIIGIWIKLLLGDQLKK